MTQKEMAKFADRVSSINERIQITYKNNIIEIGYFYNNKYSTSRQDNIWNFVIMKDVVENNINKVVNGDEVESIKIIRLY